MPKRSDPPALALGLAAGLVLGIVACRVFVVRRVREILAEDRRTFAWMARHVDTPRGRAS